VSSKIKDCFDEEKNAFDESLLEISDEVTFAFSIP
jgi:hypothetical protein